jgi:phage shock protein PspC (stress-responsive transcriptional regulator)
MSASKTAVPADRKGGPFGVCAAIGADFGFNPDILRVLLTAGLLWNPLVMAGGYGFAALLMVAGRLLFPESARETAATPAKAGINRPTPHPADRADRHVVADSIALAPERIAA